MDEKKELKVLRARFLLSIFFGILGLVFIGENDIAMSVCFVMSAMLIRPLLKEIFRFGPIVNSDEEQFQKNANRILLIIGLVVFIIGLINLIFYKNLLGITPMILGFIIAWEDLNDRLNEKLDEVDHDYMGM